MNHLLHQPVSDVHILVAFRMEIVADDDIFESPENVTIGYPILTDKDFIAIVGRKTRLR